MPLSENAKKNKMNYNKEYNKKNYKRVPLDISHKMYEDIKTASQEKGESVNGYIKTAISDCLAKDK